MGIPANAPVWQKVAFTYNGMREIKGPQTAPFIQKWNNKLGAWWKDDETAWCGTAVAAWFAEANEKYGTNIKLPKTWYRAKDWALWGKKLTKEQYRPGAICIKTRQGGGHVFQYTGEDATRIRGIGGNTGDMVKEAWYDKRDILAVVWPVEIPLDAVDRRVWLQYDGTPLKNKED